MQTEIYEYLLNKKNQRIGVVLALKRKDGTIGLGWSRARSFSANPLGSRGDVFDKEKGLALARTRALNVPVSKIPSDDPKVGKKLVEMRSRAVRYFKPTPEPLTIKKAVASVVDAVKSLI